MDFVTVAISIRKNTLWTISFLLTFLLTFFVSVTASEAKQSLSNLPSPLVGEKQDEEVRETAKVKVEESYGKLPLYFIRNDGQMDERVKYYEKGNGHTTFFTKEGVYLSLLSGNNKQNSQSPQRQEEKQSQETLHSKEISNINPVRPELVEGRMKDESPDKSLWNLFPKVIKITFLNANPNPEIVAEGIQEGKVNYFIGNDPKKWQTNILTYKAVLYKEVYPGIDIKFYGNNRQLEYDIIVKPGADPTKVRFAYEGIEELKVTENGDLEITINSPSTTNITPLKKGGQGGFEGNRIIQKKPVIYQEIEGKHVAVEGKFKALYIPPLQGEGKGGDVLSPVETKKFAYTFEIASYDKNHLLIIDPMLVYATYLGGSGDESSTGITVDAAGNVYMAGWTDSSDFPATSGAFDPTYNVGCNVNGSCVDVFVVKIDSSGSFLSYATYLGGSSSDIGHGIAVDHDGNVYVAGETRSSNFPTTMGAYDTTINGVTDPNGPADAFVAKLNATGAILIYSTYLGGSSYESGNEDMAVDAVGNVYVTGFTRSPDFPVTSGAYDTTLNDSNGSGDAFVAKLDTSGSFLSYATYLGGSSEDFGYGITVDAVGNAYVTGETRSSDFPYTPGAYDTTFNGNGDLYNGDAFVIKLNASGSLLLYATYLGGSSSDVGSGIIVDNSGNAYVTGNSRSSDFPVTLGAYDTTFNGGNWDGFVAKLNSAGTLLIYATYIGGNNGDGGHIALDAAGNIYMAGGTDSSDFPVTPDAYDSTYNGNGDAFVVMLNASGSILSYATYIGGNNFESAGGIAKDAAGNIYTMGWTNSSDFPATPGAYDTSYNGGRDVFVVKLSFPIDLPRTGQTSCYDSAGAVISCAGTGQDGEIQAGVPWPGPRFTDNSDGTVTDNLTGLMWTQSGNAPGSAACYPGTTKTWQDALDYVACLNVNSYLGYTDWHLPNILELESLVNAGQSSTAAWLNTQGFSNVQADLVYWTSTTDVDPNNPNSAWFVYMGDGFMSGGGKSAGSYYVRPVRSGQSAVAQLWETGQTTCYDSLDNAIACTGTGQDGDIQEGVSWSSPRFTVSADGYCVTDNLTGLIWVRSPDSVTTTWQQALDYANGLSLCGYTDWRLPDRKEILSLLDFSRYDPALPSGHPFLNVQSNYYWSSTTFAGSPGLAWIVNMWYGGTGANNKPYDTNCYVWPVRGGLVPPVEICDGIDNDGDGLIDEGVTNTYYQDSDGDTYGNVSVTTQACTQPVGYVSNNTDCNDEDAFINPGATEVCNLVDDNCDGNVDEGVENIYYQDLDSDTYGNVLVTTQTCTAPSGYVSNSADCNDGNASINPWAAEVCNSVDDNCNAQIDEGVQNTYYRDEDNDTFGNAAVTAQACVSPSGYVSGNTDCNDNDNTTYPGATDVLNDGIDQDCSGSDLTVETRIDGGSSGDQRFPWADYNETTGEYLVLWQDKRNGANDDIYGVRLDQNGNRVGSDFAVSTAAGHQQRVLVKAGGGGYLALWHDLRNQGTNGADIYGAWIAGDGTVGPEMAICACAKDQWNPVAGYDPVSNTFLVVFLSGTGSGSGNDAFDLWGAVIPAGGTMSVTPFTMVTETGGQRGPQIGYDYGNNQYYMAWNDRRGGVNYDIYGSRVTNTGILLDGTGVLLSGAAGNQFRPTVLDRRPASGINNHLIAWTDYRNGAQADVYGIYVDGSGAAVGSDFAISTNTADQANVVADIDWINTQKSLVGFIDQRNGIDYDIYGATVDQAGAVTGDMTIVGQATGASGEQRAEVVTYATDGVNDYGFLTVYMDRRNGTDYDIYGIKVWP